LLAAAEGYAEVDLRFGPDDSGHLGIQGTVRAELRLVCQRCLGALSFRVESNVRLALISADGQMDSLTKRVNPGFEPLVVVDDEAMVLSDIIEDELLLTLPVVPRHPEGVCEIAQKYVVVESIQNDRKKPFAGLEDLIMDVSEKQRF